MKNKLTLALILSSITLLGPQLWAFGATTYNINTFSGGNGAIVSRTTPFVAGDTLNFLNDITATSSIGSLGVFALNIVGNDYTIGANGVSNPQFTVQAGANYRFDGVKLNRFSSTAAGGAINSAGTLTVDNSSFSNNHSSDHGGAIKGRATISNSSFSNNATGGYSYGGAVYNVEAVSNSSFSDNYSFYGGAIANVRTAHSLTLDTAEFTDNYSFYGGAVYIYDNLALLNNTIQNSTFTGNHNDGRGGAIYNDNTITSYDYHSIGTLSIDNSTFTGNYANSDGGAIYNKAGLLNVTNSSFVNNRSNLGFGGAIYNQYLDDDGIIYEAILNVTDTSFTGNQAEYGGAIFSNAPTDTITNSNFNNNSSTQEGGAIYNIYSLTLTNSNFTNNSAGTKGGAIYIYGGNLNIKADAGTSTFTGNTAGGVSNAIYNDGGTVNLNAGNGGVITFDDAITSSALVRAINVNSSAVDPALVNGTVNFNGGISTATVNIYKGTTNLGKSIIPNVSANNVIFNITGGTQTFTNNTFSNSSRIIINDTTPTAPEYTNVIGSTFNDGTYTDYYYSGAIVSYFGTLNVATSNFSNNSSNGGGGAINSGGTLTVDNSSFSNNRATGSGGAIYGRSTISNSSFSGNYVNYINGFGGAVFNFEAISDSSFSNNHTTGRGGAIANSGTNHGFNIDNVDFSDNYAALGGAVYIRENTDLSNKTIQNSTFTGNYSPNGNGGAIYIENSKYDSGSYILGTLSIDNSTFSGNYALGNGGGIFNKMGILNISNSSFATNHTTNGGGGAIYNNYYNDEGFEQGILNVTNTSFTGNYAQYGGAVLNISQALFNGATFTSNSATQEGGAIYSNIDGSLTLTNSNFTNNSAGTKGGAIYNTQGLTTLTNSNFTNNSATTNGGAIYNYYATLNIKADAGTSTFTGNTAGGVSNAIYNEGGTVNLNAGNGGVITFNDKITSNLIADAINVNSGGTLNDGEVIFNNTVSNSTVNLNNGTLTFGKTGSVLTTTYLSNVNLNLNAGTLNLENGLATDVLDLNNFTSTASASMFFDANLSNNQSDKINVSGTASGTLNIAGLNVLADGTNATLTLFSGAIAPTLVSFVTNTADYEYTFTQSATAGIYNVARRATAGINPIVADITSPRSYSATDNTTLAIADLGTMGGAGSTLTIFGNNYKIDGAGFAGITALAGQTLNISGVGSLNGDGSVNNSWTNSSSTNGGVANNSGELTVLNSVFSANSASGNGGVIYNNSNATVTGSFFVSNTADKGGAIYNNGTTTITGGKFNSNTATTSGGAIYNNTAKTLSLTNTNFTSNSSVNGGAVYNLGTTTISGGTYSSNTATSNGGAIYNTGTSTITGGTYSDNSATSNGGAIYNSGTTTITSGTFNSNSATTSGGSIYNSGTLEIKNSTFTNNSTTTANGGGVIYNTSTANIVADNGTTSFSGNTANGISNSIYLASGTLNLNAGNSGAITFGDGINSSLISNNININKTGDGTAGQPSIGSPTNGTVTFNGNVNKMTMNIYSGTTTVTSTGSLTQDQLNIFGGSLNFENNTVNTSNDINLAQGTINLNAGNGGYTSLDDKILSALDTNSVNINKTGDGTAGQPRITAPVNGNIFLNKEINNATVNVYNGTTFLADSSILNNDKLSVYGGSVNFVNQNVNTSNDIYLDGGALNLNVIGESSISVNDKITSNSLSSVININKSGTGTVGQPAANAPTGGSVILNNTINNATLNMYSGTLVMSLDNALTGNNLNSYGGGINMMNNIVGTSVLNNLNLADGTTTNMAIDIDLARGTSDKLSSTTVGSGTGILNINNLNMLSYSDAASTSISLADPNLRNQVILGVSKIVTPIYQYNLNYDPSTGAISFLGGGSGGSSFNPTVLSSTVQESTGSYLNQVNSYQQAFSNMDSVMMMPRLVRAALKYRNKYADASGGPVVFSPIMQAEQSKGLWFKPYTTFENIPLKGGPTVGNVAYGALVGGDTDYTSLGRGFYGVTTGYVGYNGSRQSYDGTSVTQNGGMMGLTETIYKGNFFSALTANVGASSGETVTSFGADYFSMLTAGLASKTGYNFEVKGGKFIIQPSLLMSYTFANTFDYQNAAGVNITSNPLNAFQISPGVKFIANLKDGWQPYVGVNMVWNIMDQSKFFANDVALPSMSIAPYVEYGVGVQKQMGQRMTGFTQAMMTNGGRNGISLQAGFRWAF